MTLSNIRFSNSGNIVADHSYNETQPGGGGRRVKSVKLIAKPYEAKEKKIEKAFKLFSSSEQAHKLLDKFAKKENIEIIK